MRLGLEDARWGRAAFPISSSPAVTGYQCLYAEGLMSRLQEDDWPAAGCCVARQSRVVVVKAASRGIDEHTDKIWSRWSDIAPESALIVSTMMLS